MYIVTGASMPSRNGIMDENRLDTLIFPGEKWHKCCLIVNPEDEKAKPRFVCEHLKTIDRQKLQREWKGWCGPHKCVNPRDRCLVVDEEKDESYVAKHKGECPLACKNQCVKLTQKFECIYMGNEPPFGQEGSETPKKMFNENEQYDVFSLSTEAPEPTEACVTSTILWLPSAPVPSRGDARRHRWNHFLS
jgi:hypothetical protein